MSGDDHRNQQIEEARARQAGGARWPPASLLCDRCGFSYRAGAIWIINCVQIYFCAECKVQVQAEMDEIAKSRHRAFLEGVVRRFGLLPRDEKDARFQTLMAAALLGAYERLRNPQDVALREA